MVIRVPAQDCACTIELFYEQYTNQLVGEGHLRERNLFDCLLVQVGVESIGTSYNEDDTACSGCHTFSQPCGEVHGTAFCSVLVKQDKVVAWQKLLSHQFCLLGLLLLHRKTACVSQFRDDIELEGYIVTQTTGVVVDERLYVAVCCASDDE